MNQTLDIQRLGWLIKRIWVENRKLFGMTYVVMVLLCIAAYYLGRDAGGAIVDIDIRVGSFIAGMLGMGVLFANYIFRDFSHTPSTMSYLLLPASHLEKFLSGLFYVLIVYPIVIISTHSLIDYAAFEMIKLFYPDTSMSSVALYYFEQIHDYLDVHSAMPINSIVIIANVWTFTIMGTLFFQRLSLIKTAFLGFSSIAIIALLEYLMFHYIIGDLNNNVSFEGDLRDYITVGLVLIRFVLPLFWLLIAYLKLKEKEV
ncbi:MAG: hypothetical protein ACOVQ4_00035 [Flectobacillus sp.]|uniref:hypothetical protein n=1 Tax=Flectobacillus sp. TaxID=50419 RepID=UPI003B9D30A0